MTVMQVYDTRSDLFRLLPPHSRVVELGVFCGSFAAEILGVCHPSRLFLVDTWAGCFGSGDKDGNHRVEIPDMHAVYLDLCVRYEDSDVVRLVKSDTETFLSRCDSGTLDAVYIDAEHSYHAVYRELVGSLRVLRAGGFLMGHDYHDDVKGAVDNFCREYGLTVCAVANDDRPSFLIRTKL